MPFIHPALFYLGLGCVSLPVIIHLLNRKRFRVLKWAAMQFLLESVRRNRRRLRIEELILLALRCLVILALAIAIGRFTGCEAMQMLPGGDGAHTSVFVLDDTYSTGQKVGSATIFHAAAADLAQQIQKLPKNDKFAIVLACDNPHADPFLKLTDVSSVDMKDLLDLLAARKPSDRRVGLAQSLRTAEDILAGQTGAKRLYLLSDFRKNDLNGQEQAEAIRTRFRALASQGVEVISLDYGRDGRDNLTIEAIELLDKFALANKDMRIRVLVKNNGPDPVEDVKVSVSAQFAHKDGPRQVTLPVRIIDSIAPGQSEQMECKVTPPEAGSMVISAKIEEDELAGDNTAQLALKVLRALRVLIVDGQPDLTDPMESESIFLHKAIDPNGNAGAGVAVKVITTTGLDGENLDNYDVVALLDVSDLPARMGGSDGKSVVYPQLKAIERYVRNGGGLVIFTGDNVNLTFYNGPLFADGMGLSPFRIGPRTGSPLQRDKYYRLDPASISGEQVVRQFYGPLSIQTQFVRFHAFTPAEETHATIGSATVKPPRVLARFTDPQNSPAIAARQFGAGTVLVYYTTSSMKWNDWASDEPSQMFVAPMLDMVSYLARTQPGRTGRSIGEPIVMDLSEDMRDAKAILKTPAYPEADLVNLTPRRKFHHLADRMLATAGELKSSRIDAANALGIAAGNFRDALTDRDMFAGRDAIEHAIGILKPLGSDNGSVRQLSQRLNSLLESGLEHLIVPELQWSQTDRAGVYSITLEVPGKSASTVFFARNTDPAEGQLTPGGREGITAAFGSDDFHYIQRGTTSAITEVKTSGGREYWRWAMVAMLVFLAAETVLAQRFGHYSHAPDNKH